MKQKSLQVKKKTKTTKILKISEGRGQLEGPQTQLKSIISLRDQDSVFQTCNC